MSKTFCNGCMHDYEQGHLLRKHRRDAQCGGRFVSEEVFTRMEILRRNKEELARIRREARTAR